MKCGKTLPCIGLCEVIRIIKYTMAQVRFTLGAQKRSTSGYRPMFLAYFVACRWFLEWKRLHFTNCSWLAEIYIELSPPTMHPAVICRSNTRRVKCIKYAVDVPVIQLQSGVASCAWWSEWNCRPCSDSSHSQCGYCTALQSVCLVL